MIAVCGVLFVVALFVVMAIAIILAPNLFSAALHVGEGVTHGITGVDTASMVSSKLSLRMPSLLRARGYSQRSSVSP
jgi:hypothetical protein